MAPALPSPRRLVLGTASAAGTAVRLSYGVGRATVNGAVGVVRVPVDAATIAAEHAARVVIARVVQVIVESVDITALVRDNVDIDAIAERIDLDRIVNRLDLIDLADTVIDGVDLPRIIRESTTSMSTEAMNGARVQSMHADDVVATVVGRLLGRARNEEVVPVEPRPS